MYRYLTGEVFGDHKIFLSSLYRDTRKSGYVSACHPDNERYRSPGANTAVLKNPTHLFSGAYFQEIVFRKVLERMGYSAGVIQHITMFLVL